MRIQVGKDSVNAADSARTRSHCLLHYTDTTDLMRDYSKIQIDYMAQHLQLTQSHQRERDPDHVINVSNSGSKANHLSVTSGTEKMATTRTNR